MAGSFSSRKVARAARTGGGRRRDTNSSLGWYAALVVIAILGTLLVVVSRNDRLSTTNYGSTAPLAPSPTRTGDYWVESYGLYICDKYVANIDDSNDPYGITTKNDGVIHIHPYQRKYAGHNAKLGLFSKVVGLDLKRDAVTVPKDKTYGPGAKCGDQEGELVVKEWTKAADDSTGKIVKVNPSDLLLKDGAAVTIAFVPKGKTDIPLPPSAPNLPAIGAVDKAAATGSTGTTGTSAVPLSTPSTTAAPASSTTTAAP